MYSMVFMEKIYLPPKVGNVLGLMTLGLAGMTMFHAIDAYGQAKYFDGQADILRTTEQHQSAQMAEDNVDAYRASIIGDAGVALGFISISSVSFYLSARGYSRRDT
jgi:hypothetical protein